MRRTIPDKCNPSLWTTASLKGSEPKVYRPCYIGFIQAIGSGDLEGSAMVMHSADVCWEGGNMANSDDHALGSYHVHWTKLKNTICDKRIFMPREWPKARPEASGGQAALTPDDRFSHSQKQHGYNIPFSSDAPPKMQVMQIGKWYSSNQHKTYHWCASVSLDGEDGWDLTKNSSTPELTVIHLCYCLRPILPSLTHPPPMMFQTNWSWSEYHVHMMSNLFGKWQWTVGWTLVLWHLYKNKPKLTNDAATKQEDISKSDNHIIERWQPFSRLSAHQCWL
jgi:hypothetical protein